ncbi:MAG: hypothetical protein EA416_12595 [Trueperaceae bacterium]|nr:MAG: hypothetical protein EA416_12595 [Trueperaceae bacterium]
MRFVLSAKVYSYLVRHADAIRVLSSGLEHHPDDPVLLRHRGEFHLTVRAYRPAIEDLVRAAAGIEGRPDQIDPYQAQLLPLLERALLAPHEPVPEPELVSPEALEPLRGAYVGSLASSVWYHLALARFLDGDFVGAARDFEVAADGAALPDTRVAAVNWGYLAHRRAGDRRAADALLATVATDAPLAEASYGDNLAVYRGEREPGEPSGRRDRSWVTRAYGNAAFCWLEGDRERAGELLDAVLAVGDTTSFAHIAALETRTWTD